MGTSFRRSWYVAIAASLFVGLFNLVGCDKFEDDDDDDVKISEHFGDDGHHFGEDCMNCHYRVGEGEGWFTVAGSVTKADMISRAVNGMVRLYTEPGGQGDLILELEVDGGGYFFTTQNVDLSQGYYAVVESAQGMVRYMDTIAHYGDCNVCHNQTEPTIYVEP